ncbi:hypothetical protein F4815DRAFT_455167 [Daldinia loculata]|uniref:uncharacterized protein n=1 Tax=Daldinia loculata TaxID=103429 RepID=UPI0020C3B6AC|nr:uncharacterized protein F4817DRAFT_347527 [Daldinia loculata]KAI1644190.1 hypothetical protein F4817DRAFT_347527 [Daldinia loculata]KAI2784269.1 hypothetical protein F4815DRAFT_455167 [Daldinia loculata]
MSGSSAFLPLLEIFQNLALLGLGPISGLFGNLMRRGALADGTHAFPHSYPAIHTVPYRTCGGRGHSRGYTVENVVMYHFVSYSY